MKPRTSVGLLAFALASFLVGCVTNSNGTVIRDPPHCVVASMSGLKNPGPTDFGTFPTVDAVVTNDGTGEARNVMMRLRAMRGATILEEKFASVTSLKPKQSASFTFMISNSTAANSPSFETQLTWSDYDGGYYSNP